MAEVSFTILDEGRATEVTAELAGERVRLAGVALERSLGWDMKPQGLCRGDVCIPVPGRSGLVSDRARVLQGGSAPDFALPDLSGREWRLSGLRGKKVLLVAYASW
jgi:hypothetical protein